MRTKLVGLVLGLGCLLGTAAPSFACAFHDQQASAATQQQTAGAQSGTTHTE